MLLNINDFLLYIIIKFSKSNDCLCVVTRLRCYRTWSRVPCDHNPILTREYSDKSGFIRFHSFIYNVEILCIILCYRNFRSFYIFFYFSSIFFLVLKLIIHFIDHMKIGKIINKKHWWICYNKENNEQFSSGICYTRDNKREIPFFCWE